MGALVAVVSKRHGKANVIPEAIKMLKALKHRGDQFYGIATDKTAILAKDPFELSDLSRNVSSDIVIGYNFRRILREDEPQPVEVGNLKVILEGRVYSPQPMKSEVYEIIKRHGEEGLKKVIAEMEGSFILTILSGRRLLVGRDAIGAAPLYFSENEQVLALASERKALWSIGMRDENIRPFSPGSMAEITGEGIILRQVKALQLSGERWAKDERSILEELHTILSKSIEERVHNLEGKVSVAFSGGLDSSIIAALLKKEANIDTILVTVGLEGSKEIEHAEKVADEIGLRIRTRAYAIEDVEKTLPKVLWLIEEADGLKVSIKIPEYWTAEVSSKMGCKAIFFGEGGDELFGGYYKYLEEYKRSLEDVERRLFLDTVNLYHSLEMSEKICAFHGLEARFPYADYELATFALKIPISKKILSMDDPLRKWILRRYAEQIGLPSEVYLKPKKAIQYGTGVSKALKKIAEKNGLSMHGLVNKIFGSFKASMDIINKMI
ncbi:MAG: asparagine synthetase B [Candidatus Bathyarchaeia archaeon]